MKTLMYSFLLMVAFLSGVGLDASTVATLRRVNIMLDERNVTLMTDLHDARLDIQNLSQGMTTIEAELREALQKLKQCPAPPAPIWPQN